MDNEELSKEEIDDAIRRQEQEHAEAVEGMEQKKDELDHFLGRIQDEDLVPYKPKESVEVNEEPLTDEKAGEIRNSIPYWKSYVIDKRQELNQVRADLLSAQQWLDELEADKFEAD
jgi:hypothetical protein